jgi:hypothetical protein
MFIHGARAAVLGVKRNRFRREQSAKMVLRRGRQVELLAHEAHPAQPQSAESDVILQLCEECFHSPPSPLRDRERWALGYGMGSLPRWLTSTDGDTSKLSSRAVALLRAVATAFRRQIIKMDAVAGIVVRPQRA